jgi:hypothetical protein
MSKTGNRLVTSFHILLVSAPITLLVTKTTGDRVRGTGSGDRVRERFPILVNTIDGTSLSLSEIVACRAHAGGDDDDGGVDRRARAVPERCPSRCRADVHSCWPAIKNTGPEHRRFAAPWPGELWLSWLTSLTLVVSYLASTDSGITLKSHPDFVALIFLQQNI